MRTTRSVLALTVALVAVLGMTGCTQVSSSSSKSNGSGASSSAQETTAGDSSASASETSSESPSESTSESSSSSSESVASSNSSSDSSSSSSRATVSDSELIRFADNNTVRACKVREVSYITGGARFCSTDSSVITMDYAGQQIYVTLATKYESGAKYTYSGHVATDSKTKQSFPITGTPRNGAPLTLYVPATASGATTLSVTFYKNDKEIGSKTVQLSKK